MNSHSMNWKFKLQFKELGHHYFPLIISIITYSIRAIFQVYSLFETFVDIIIFNVVIVIG